MVNDVIATAMAKAQENRYPTCGEMVRALRAAVGHGDAVVTETASTVQGAAATVYATSPDASTPAPTADEPPAAPASAAPKEQRTMAITRGRIVAAAAILVAVIAAAVAAALLIGGNDSSS